mmetsp:Transcript_32435/g.100368  ORF Transcript_32435/g.100368 Transcript_32435/m.100368 type:complete len:325 (+) Transcript_32435:826-1800(+)
MTRAAAAASTSEDARGERSTSEDAPGDFAGRVEAEAPGREVLGRVEAEASGREVLAGGEAKAPDDDTFEVDPPGSVTTIEIDDAASVRSDATPPPFEITVPPDKRPGEELVVEVGGSTLVVRVPPGARAGDTFYIAAPNRRDDDAASTPRATPIEQPPTAVATPVRDILDELQRLELAGFFGGAAAELTELEQVLIAYAASVKCLALFHTFLIALYSLLIDRLVGLALVVGPVSGYYGAHVLSQCWVFIYLLFCIGCVVFGFWVFVSVAFRFYYFLLFILGLWIAKVVMNFSRVLAAVGPARAREIANARFEEMRGGEWVAREA